MRVVLVGAGLLPIPPPRYGAVEKHIWNLARSLRDLGHEADIVNDTRSRGPLAEYAFGLRSRRPVRRVDPDVLHLHTPGVAAVYRTFGPRRYVYTTHSRHWTTREGWRQRVGYRLERRACRGALRAIAVSPTIVHRLSEMGVRATHVPNGVDTRLYRPDRQARDGRRLVGLGAVLPHKQWHLAASAVRGLDATLVLVGPTPDASYADRVRSAAPGQVDLVGEVPEEELAQLLGRADVMVHPSLSEASPMAVLEGLASGLPIVASHLVGDLVRPGENGRLVPTQGPEEARVQALREALEGILNDDSTRRRMGERSRARAEADFDWSAVARQILSVYHQALEEKDA